MAVITSVTCITNFLHLVWYFNVLTLIPYKINNHHLSRIVKIYLNYNFTGMCCHRTVNRQLIWVSEWLMIILFEIMYAIIELIVSK